MLDNHISKIGQEEYQRRGSCACGGLLEEIDWCAPEHCRCEEGCGNDTRAFDCAVIETRLLCKKCGAVLEAE